MSHTQSYVLSLCVCTLSFLQLDKLGILGPWPDGRSTCEEVKLWAFQTIPCSAASVQVNKCSSTVLVLTRRYRHFVTLGRTRSWCLFCISAPLWFTSSLAKAMKGFLLPAHVETVHVHAPTAVSAKHQTLSETSRTYAHDV